MTKNKNIYKKRKSIFKKGLKKRILVRSEFVASGLILGGSLGVALSGTPTGLATLAGSVAGLVTAQRLATMHFKRQAKAKKALKAKTRAAHRAMFKSI